MASVINLRCYTKQSAPVNFANVARVPLEEKALDLGTILQNACQQLETDCCIEEVQGIHGWLSAFNIYIDGMIQSLYSPIQSTKSKVSEGWNVGTIAKVKGHN